MSNPTRIGKLLYSKRRNELTAKEELELAAWRSLSPENEQLYQDKMNPEKLRIAIKELYESKARVFEEIRKKHPELDPEKLPEDDFSDMEFHASMHEKKYFRMFPQSRAARFGFLIVISVVIYVILRMSGVIHKTVRANPEAMMISDGGLEVPIDGGNVGFRAARAHIDLEDNQIGEKDYYATSRDKDRRLRYSLPTGDIRHFRLILPDGTWIWVHPDTRIKYPVNFSQDSIHITVLGKAYFEVNRDSLHPYIIIQPSIVSHLPSATLMIEAVSAHFDVEAYPDSSAMRITAITGNLSIRVDSVGGKQRSKLQLFAGQQLEAKDGKIDVIQNVDVNKVLTRAKWYGGK